MQIVTRNLPIAKRSHMSSSGKTAEPAATINTDVHVIGVARALAVS